MWLILLATFVLVLIIFVAKKIHHLYVMDRMVGNLPSPPARPLIGHYHHVFGASAQDFYDNMIRLTFAFDQTYKFWLGTFLVVCVYEKEHIRAVLQCVDKPLVYSFFPFFMRQCMALCKESIWRITRKKVNPVFHPTAIRALTPIFNRKADKLVDVLNRYANRGPIDLSNFLFSANLDVISETAFDYDLDCQNSDAANEIMSSIGRVIATGQTRINKLIPYMYDFFWQFTEDYRNFAIQSKSLQSIIRNIRESTEFRNRFKAPDTTAKFKVIYKILEMRESGAKTANEVDGEMALFFFAGIETSASTTLMVILMMAMHPAVQHRVYDEIQLLDLSQPLSYDDVTGRLPYTEMVIKETMRLFPITGVLPREIAVDVKLADFTLPKGSTCVLPIIKLHRSKKLWGDDSEVFDPDRFSAERSAARESYFYMPFSAGPRNCIGHRYAMVSMKIFLCQLIKRYKFSTHMRFSELKYSYTPFFKLLNKYAVTIEHR